MTPELNRFGSGFVWLHYDLHGGDLPLLLAQMRFGPHTLIVNIFGPDSHQRMLVDGDHVGGVVVDLARPGTGPEPAGRIHFLLGPHSLVSGRVGPAESPQATRAMAERGKAITSPVLLLEAMVARIVTAMSTTGEKLSDELDGIEDRIIAGRMRDDERRLGPIRRSAVRLHRQILGLSAVFHRLDDDDTARDLHGSTLALAGRLVQRLDALDRDVAMLAERSRLLQDEIAAREAEDTNRQLYILSVLSALFLPPTFITGLFGMNVKALPFADDLHGFGIVVILSILSAIVSYGAIRLLGIRPPRSLKERNGTTSRDHRFLAPERETTSVRVKR